MMSGSEAVDNAKVTHEERKAAALHLESEAGPKPYGRFDGHQYWKVVEAVALQRRLLAKEGIITAEDPYPEATLDLSPWGIVNPAFKRRGQPTPEQAEERLKENEALLRKCLEDKYRHADLEPFIAINPETYEQRLDDACNYIRAGKVKDSVFATLGLTRQQTNVVATALSKGKINQAETTVTESESLGKGVQGERQSDKGARI